jgi:hypothetical protein
MMNAGMPMPPASASMPMPSYDQGPLKKYASKNSPE